MRFIASGPTADDRAANIRTTSKRELKDWEKLKSQVEGTSVPLSLVNLKQDLVSAIAEVIAQIELRGYRGKLDKQVDGLFDKSSDRLMAIGHSADQEFLRECGEMPNPDIDAPTKKGYCGYLTDFKKRFSKVSTSINWEDNTPTGKSKIQKSLATVHGLRNELASKRAPADAMILKEGEIALMDEELYLYSFPENLSTHELRKSFHEAYRTCERLLRDEKRNISETCK